MRQHGARSLRKAIACALTIVLAAVASFTPSTTTAAPCAGFTDVDSASGFCPSVEWIRNRSITLGCSSATLFCPDSPVNRLTMAAFLNRLGTAVTPVQVRQDTSTGLVDLDVSPVVCQTDDFVVVDFPRHAYIDLALSVSGFFDLSLAADLAYSTDGGATWTNLNTRVNRGSALANQWGTLSDIAYQNLEVGQSVRWGVRMSRGGLAGVGDVSDGRCQLRALIYSRDGTSSPR